MPNARALTFALSAIFSSMLVLLAACGSTASGSASGPDAATDGSQSGADGGVASDAGGDSAATGSALAFPEVVSWGVPQMTSPKVVTITFQGDTMATGLQGFGSNVAQSSWWSTVIADYCPADAGGCAGQPGVNDAITTAAAPSYVDTATGDPSQLPDGGVPIWNVLTTEIAASHVPAPDLDTIYMIYLPATSSVSLDGDPSCGDYDGYHNQTTYTSGGTTVPVIYGVSFECTGYQLSDVTLTSSHEIVEAATDGYSTTQGGGYYLDTVADDPNTFAWNDVAGGEVADLCVDMLGLNQDHTTEGSYTAQRIWSTSRAAQVKDPCIPVPAGNVYFNAYPDKSFFIMNVGDTRTIPLTGFADGAHPDWWVFGQDATVDSANPNMMFLQIDVPTGTINDGKTLPMTVKLLADPTDTDNGEADGLLFSVDNASLGSAKTGNWWPFAVMTPAAAQDAGIAEPSHLHARRAPVHRRPSTPRR